LKTLIWHPFKVSLLLADLISYTEKHAAAMSAECCSLHYSLLGKAYTHTRSHTTAMMVSNQNWEIVFCANNRLYRYLHLSTYVICSSLLPQKSNMYQIGDTSIINFRNLHNDKKRILSCILGTIIFIIYVCNILPNLHIIFIIIVISIKRCKNLIIY
jgi:hypothetical protein